MAIATGARSKVGYIVETTFGTTPTTPNLIELPFTSFGVNLTRDEFDDNSIRGDRMERYSVSGNRSVGGSIDVNFSHGVYDVLLESLMQASFASNVLKTGVSRKSLSVEECALDVSQYRVYTGIVVDKLDMTIPASGFVTAKFDVVGKDQSALTGTSVDSDGYTAAANKVPFTDNGVSGFMKEGGSIVGYVTNLSFSVDNGITKNYAVGPSTVRDLTTGNSTITGTATVFFEDAVMYNKWLNGTLSSIDTRLDDGTNTYQFFFPSVKYTAAAKTISGNGPITLAMPFKALFDATSNSHIVITRS